MAMTLKQGFTIWACAPRNTVLAAKSREAVQKVLMKKWGDIDLEQITPAFAERIFRKSPHLQELKVKAASILVYILQWGSDHGHCQRPTFDYTIANSGKDADPLAGIDFDDKKQVADALMEQSARIMDDKPKEETVERREQRTESHSGYAESRQGSIKNQTNMSNEKKQGIQPPKAVVQMDSETLAVIKTWESVCQAERDLHIKNITRAILKHSMAGGYYWCRPEVVSEFKPAKKHKGGRPSKHEPEPRKEKGILEKFEEERRQFEEHRQELVQPKFKVGDHVWAKQPKELYGRDGYVTSVDKMRKMYGVTSGPELWSIREDDLELVNEPVTVEYVIKRKTENLAEYTDDELIAEMKRRGWKGNITMTVSVEL